jgi:hypothetical protein
MRQHRARERAWRQLGRRCGVCLHPQRLDLDPARQQAGRHYSVALSADGNTAIVGGRDDNVAAGAAWVFTRSGGVWSQQGSKLVGTGASGVALQGQSVALSADGNTALVGGYNDNSSVGAAWVFTRSAGVWTQVGSKLVGTGASGFPQFGTSIALSGDGNTALVGGPIDGSAAGAAWVFVQRGLLTATHDFNGAARARRVARGSWRGLSRRLRWTVRRRRFLWAGI